MQTAPGLVDKNALRIGQKVPTFRLPTLDGHRIDTAVYRGRPYLVTFWGSWCIPCREEMPLLQRVYQARGGKLPIVGVTYQDPVNDSRDFVRAHRITFPITPDDGIRVASAFGVLNGIPQTYFVDANGIVKDHVAGSGTAKDLQRAIDRFLAA
ncbi:MAG: thiol-disulfide isomerase-like thioredoxin [Actinomycetia bacterium]|nr:thiol-disulfide isomerase-like thioredoxin [Actinomycetes bacterium]